MIWHGKYGITFVSYKFYFIQFQCENYGTREIPWTVHLKYILVYTYLWYMVCNISISHVFPSDPYPNIVMIILTFEMTLVRP